MKSYFLPLLCLLVVLISGFSDPKPIKEQEVLIVTRFGKVVVKLYNETPQHRDNFIKLVKLGFYDSLLFHRIIPGFMAQGGDPISKLAPKDTMLGNGELYYLVPAEISTTHFHKRGALAAARNSNPAKASNGSQFYIVQGKQISSEELANLENQKNYAAKSKMFSDMLHADSMQAKYQDYILRGDKNGLQSFMLSMQEEIDQKYKPFEITFTQEQITTYMQIGGAPHLDGEYTVFGEVVYGMSVIDSIIAQPRDKNDRPIVNIRMKMQLLK
jgi:cyclophilin family peptidyl-prolyl cis-trans isomerase